MSETFRAGLRGIIHAASLALCPTLLNDKGTGPKYQEDKISDAKYHEQNIRNKISDTKYQEENIRRQISGTEYQTPTISEISLKYQELNFL